MDEYIRFTDLYNVTNPSNGDRCFMSVFGSNSLKNWVMGESFLRSFYTVYDLSPKELYGKDYINIALGRNLIVN